MNSRNSSESPKKPPDPNREFDDYAAAARTLESPQLVWLLGNSLMLGEKYDKWDGRERRREILRKELTRRAIDPYSFTMEDFRLVFKPRRIKEEEQEQQMRACIALVQRATGCRPMREVYE